MNSLTETNEGMSGRSGKNGSCIVYLIDIDVSRDNGAGVNERGFVSAAIKSEGMVCVLPEPRHGFRFDHPGVEYVFGHKGVWWRYPLWQWAAFARLMRLRSRRRVAAIATRLGGFPLPQYLFSLLTGVPILLAKHSGYQPLDRLRWRDILLPFGKGKLRTLRIRAVVALSRPLHRLVARRAIMVDAPSPLCRETVIWRDGCEPERVIVLLNGANVDLFRPLDRDEQRTRLGMGRWRFVVGYVGALNRDKRCMDHLVRAMAQLRKKGVDAGCVIVGDGPDRSALEALAREEGIASHVAFVGVVPHGEVPAYMSAFDVGIDLCAAPMKVADGRVVYSSYSQKMAQYLACGVPVLAWDLPDTRYLQQNGIGFLVPLQDRDQFLKTLEAAQREAEPERAARKRRAREYAVQHLSYDELASTRLRLWRAAVNGMEKGGG
jgi:glycosyltransferase involved in cell wall biosynthesis